MDDERRLTASADLKDSLEDLENSFIRHADAEDYILCNTSSTDFQAEELLSLKRDLDMKYKELQLLEDVVVEECGRIDVNKECFLGLAIR